MRRPDSLRLLAFVTIVVLLGVNFVAAKFSNRELPPLWGAALRFATASVITLIYVRIRRIPLPKGEELFGAALFGTLAFATGLGFVYWALLHIKSGLASVIFSTNPLLTLLIASAIGQEKFTWKKAFGATIVISGIFVVFREQLRFNVPLAPLAAVLVAAASTAMSGIAIRRYRQGHPTATNAVGMGVASVMLLCASFIRGESHPLPTMPATWIALGWLVMSASVAFALMIWILAKWSASTTAYQAVFSPLVTLATAAALAGETLTPTFAIGSALVLLGVYVGTVHHDRQEHLVPK